MMGSSRINERGKAPVFIDLEAEENNANAKSNTLNIDSAHGMNFLDGNADNDLFDPFDDIKLLLSPGWDKYHQDIAQGIPESSGNPMDFETNPNSFQMPDFNLSPDSFENMRWNSQCLDLGQSAISAGGMNDGVGISNLGNPWSNNNPSSTRNFSSDIQMSRNVGESNIGTSLNQPQLHSDIGGSSFQLYSRDSTPVHTQNSVNLNSNQFGVQGKSEGSFLSLGIGGSNEADSRSQLNSRESTERLKEAALAELNLGRARRVMEQSSDADFMGIHRNISGFSNQFSPVDRTTPTNNVAGGNLSLNCSRGPSPYQFLQLQQKDTQHISRHDSRTLNLSSSRNLDSDHYRAAVGNQVVNSGTMGGNSAQLLNAQQLNLNNAAPELAMPSWINSNRLSGQVLNSRSGTDINSASLELGIPNNAGMQGQFLAQRPVSTQGMLSQRTVTPQGLHSQRTVAPPVGWVSSGQADPNGPFPKRLGVELNGRNSHQAAQRRIFPMRTSSETTSTGQIHQQPDKQSTRLPNHVIRPSVVGVPVSNPLNSQVPVFAHGQTQDALIQLPKDARVATSTNASTVDAQPHFRPYLQRTAVPPHLPSHWVQRQKIIQPTNSQSVPRPAIPVPTVPVHHPLAVRSRAQPAGPVAAPVRPSIPSALHVRPRAPLATAPRTVHITRKAPDTTPKLSGYKCFLCKRDLALTSEGAVFQPAVPPPVAILPCGHTFHDQCLENITPQDQAKDPPCIPCAIGEN